MIQKICRYTVLLSVVGIAASLIAFIFVIPCAEKLAGAFFMTTIAACFVGIFDSILPTSD